MSESRRSGNEQASDVRQLLKALLVTLISVGMLLGSFLLARLDVARVPPTLTQAVAEGPTTAPFLPTLTPELSPTAPVTPPTSPPTEETREVEEAPHSPTPTSDQTQAPTPTKEGTATPTLAKGSTAAPTCIRPPGWFLYTVRRGDTLTALARRSGTTALILMQRNCLKTAALFPGQHLFVPPAFYATPTPEPCGPPLHWVIYIVQPGDTLYTLSRRFNVEIEELRRANCLKSYAIYVGQALYVPPLPPTPVSQATSTPSPTPSPSSTPTRLPTSTPTTVAPTSTPNPTASRTLPPPPTTTTPSPTSDATATPTATPTPTAVSEATLTPSPSSTPTRLPTPTPTTVAPTPTPSPSPTTPPPPTTTTPSPTSDATATPTVTPTPSATSAG